MESRDRIPGNIAWVLPQQAPKEDFLEEEREKHRRRAERFNASYVDPSKATSRPELMLEAKKERLKRDGFVTGFDPFTEAEKQKRQDRAARFNISPPPAVEYKPDDEITAKAKRAVKFGVKYEPSNAVLMDMDLFEKRHDAGLDVERRPEAVHLYGVDLMSSKDCLQYFEGFGPTFVEWINDSSCNVLFSDAASAKRAIIGTGHPLPPTDESSTAGLDPTDLNNLPYLWHQGQDFAKDGMPVRLIYRMATVEDVKDVKAPRNTRELWKQSLQPDRRAKSRRRDDGQSAPDSAGVDEDGDVEMTRARNPRGGKRVRRRKMRMDVDGEGEGAIVYEDDVEMEDGEAANTVQEPSGQQGLANVTDLRTIIQSNNGAAGVSVDMGPFSAVMSL